MEDLRSIRLWEAIQLIERSLSHLHERELQEADPLLRVGAATVSASSTRRSGLYIILG